MIIDNMYVFVFVLKLLLVLKGVFVEDLNIFKVNEYNLS